MDLTTIVRNYVYDKRCDGALLINGAWGLGKSYYFREKLIPDLQRQDKNLKFVYVSLNGVADSGQIARLIAMEKWPFTKGKAFKVGTTIAGFLLSAIDHIPGVNKAIGTQSLDKLGALNLDDFLDFKDTVLCLDDFERNKMQQAVLGFVNTHFVETARVKTIIIGNESEIEKPEEYYRIKEKVIFRTIQFNTTVPVQVLADHYKDDPPFFSLITGSLPYLEALAKGYSIKNLRTLIFFLDILNRITLSQVFKQNKATNEAIFLASLIISNEFREGTLTSLDYGDYKNLENLSTPDYQAILAARQLRKAKDEKTEVDNQQPSYEIQFYEKYNLDKAPNFFFFKSIYNFILSGDLDDQQLQSECLDFEKMQGTKSLSSSPEKEALQVLQNLYWAASDNQIEGAIKNTLSGLDAGNYLFYEYAAVSDLLKQAQSLGFIKGRQEHLKTRIHRGLKVAIKKSNIPDTFLTVLQQQFYQGQDKEINKIINDEFSKRSRNADEISADSFFSALEGDWGTLQHRYSTFELFKILTPKAVAEKLIVCSNQGLRFFNSLLDQYNRTTNVATFLGQYKKEHSDLKDILRKKSRAEKSGLKKFILNTTVQQLEQLEKKLP